MGSDYRPVPLGELANAGVDRLSPALPPQLGSQTMRGLPFEVRADPGRCFLAVESAEPARLPLPEPAHVRWVVVAHRLLGSQVLAGGPVGEVVANYTLAYAGGERVSIPIRERFEVGIVQATGEEWGQRPLLAAPSRVDAHPPRHHGSFAATGHRLTEIDIVTADYFLWAWQNPRPDLPLAAIEFRAGETAATVLVAGVTVSRSDEDPLRLPPARPVRVEVLGDAPGQALDLTVAVDRGVASMTKTVPRPVDATDPLAGWGGLRNTSRNPVYAAVAGIPSATVTVLDGDRPLAATTWANLEREGRVDVDGVRIEVVESGRNWVHTIVVDDATDEALPCRIHFRSPQGVPYQPYGHPSHLNSDLYEHNARLGADTGTWGLDFGGDVRLGGTTYAYIDGRCQGWLPRGDVVVEAARGFEYEPLRATVAIAPGQRELTVRMTRRSDLAAEGWYSGDTHVHFLSVPSAHAEARGEGLHVVNLLATQWGSAFSSGDQFTGAASVGPDGTSLVYVSQENRQHILGHLSLLGLTEPVMPWCTDGTPEAEQGGPLETTLSHWADQARRQGAMVVLPHFPNPNGEPAALVATGRVDAVEFADFRAYSHEQYYRYLNAGYRIPLVGGTDKMSGDVAVGLSRTYAHLLPGDPFDYDSWCRAVRAGRTFVTSGPLIFMTVDGEEPGATIRLRPGGGTVHVEARVESVFPVHELQIVQGGRVVAAASSATGSRSLSLAENVRVESDTWLAARTAGPGYSVGLRHRDDWSRGVMAHTSPVYLACGDTWQPRDRAASEEMLTLIDGGLEYIRTFSTRWDDSLATHHHGEPDHLSYLERPLLEARRAVLDRLDRP